MPDELPMKPQQRVLRPRLLSRAAAAMAATLGIIGGIGLAGLEGCSGGESAAQNNPELARLEQEMFRAINRYRDSIGLHQLQWSEVAAEQGRLHSRRMAAGDVPLGHEGAEERTEIIGKKITWTSISENVAFSTKRSDMIPFLVDRWLASPGHRRNIEGDFDLTGIGAALSPDGRYFFTQIFLSEEVSAGSTKQR